MWAVEKVHIYVFMLVHVCVRARGWVYMYKKALDDLGNNLI